MNEVKFDSNLKEVENALEQTVSRALFKVGAFVETESKTIVPVDTGRLKNSIEHQENSAEQYTEIGSKVEYAPYVETGTYKMKAQPYLRPAIERNKSQIKSIIEGELNK